MSSWSNLPNAQLIDEILAHETISPKRWHNLGNEISHDLWSVSYHEALKCINHLGRNIIMLDIMNSRSDNPYSTYDAVEDAVLALLAFDNYGYILECTPEEVMVMAVLGNKAAPLLYPASIAMSDEPLFIFS
jgi:hypothetical protein